MTGGILLPRHVRSCGVLIDTTATRKQRQNRVALEARRLKCAQQSSIGSESDVHAPDSKVTSQKRHSVERCAEASSALDEPAQTDTRRRAGRVRIRQAREADTAHVARLCAEVFGPATFHGFPALLRASSKLQQQASVEIYKDVDSQLLRSLKMKRKAQQEAREFRLQQLNAMMKAEIGRLNGRASFEIPMPSAIQQQAKKRWRRSRQFACLVAIQEQNPDIAAGCAVISLSTPEALLPPPWPSRAEIRCTVSNLCVAEGVRRQGVARQILQSCEALARRWGYTDLWLHTEFHNTVAKHFYSSVGFQELKHDPKFFGPFRRVLLRKELH